ncbi:DNA gyrase subunit A [Clostridium sp. D2Q-11]|uniref:DNA gyrase subunit A n=1 Tax=Anaeromonas frigoriresistens TaxID=2683708 RepID=A0A942UXD7_9FIRM|nr:DNA gyrase subunit A [Anaeromonas frigoriresistens]MBS4539320.1 DNA gyrase subunit A [Anaeromonas frigoriresistens]
MSENHNNIIPINIEDEMKTSYLDYAMSVIVSRALPDVRDGLKPVHRRIIYAMNGLGLTPDKPHKKSARIVGEVLGKYHPHGDSAVYDAMVRLAQDFSTRYQLVDGHGNFGSVDGDSAAAMRYTEARMSKIAIEMLRDIGKDTIDYRPNFDEELEEPIVLPSRYPNLLVNGTNGIAVGMATSIPPHNLREVIDGVIMMIDDPDIELKDIMTKIKGPDFPTGSIITGKEAIKDAYRTGRGKVRVRAKTQIEPMKNNKNRIIVTEIPYQVNKARLIEKIAHLVRDKKLDGISDLRDESDRTGMRIVIELKRDANPNVVLNNLYKHTQMQDTYSIIMIALVNEEPKVLNLKQILRHYLDHQKEVITRRTQYDLNKAEARAHILEGLKIALDHIDEVIKLIRASENTQEAKNGLIDKFGLSEIQAQAILDMRLQKLTGLERDKIEEEYKGLIQEINKLKEILANEDLIYKIVKDELIEIKEKYGDDRKTEIRASIEEINVEDMIEEENVVLTLTHYGYVKRLPENTYKIQHRGGRGVTGLTTRDEDFVEDILITSTHDNLLFFTSKGKVYTIRAFEIPEAKRQAKGTAIVNLLQLDPDEKVKAVIPIKEFEKDSYLIFATQNGLVKKTDVTQFESIRKSGLIAINLKEDDELISVKKTTGKSDVLLTTIHGMSIRFNEKNVRDMGRTAMGVKGITLNREDKVISMNLVEEGSDLLVISEKGYGKRTDLDEYRTQTRGGKGIKTYNIKPHTGNLIGARVVNENDEIMIISYLGVIIRLKIAGISQMGRTTQGVKLMRVGKDDRVVSIAKVLYQEEELEEEN